MPLYRVVRWTMFLIMRLIFRVKVHGLENVPAQGPIVVCSNHFSWWDPFLAGGAIKRPMHFMTKAEAFDFPIVGRFLPSVGAIPVKRGQADRRALVTALNYLAAEKPVFLFIEGTRSRTGKLLPAYPGAAWLAVRQRAPILPIAIKGEYKAFKQIDLYVGQPFELEEYYHQRVNSNKLAKAGQKIMGQIEKLLATEDA